MFLISIFCDDMSIAKREIPILKVVPYVLPVNVPRLFLSFVLKICVYFSLLECGMAIPGTLENNTVM